MGLAASQARFLCITARKADCEYKSTELAQQKLELTSKMADISNEYAQAMNATKLVWQTDATSDAYTMGYNLLMTPSAMNGYNPYLITSQSGAIILNSEYAAAARAAGISKAGGAGSQLQRDKFITALAAQGMMAESSAQNITENDFQIETITGQNGTVSFEGVAPTNSGMAVYWNPYAGMGDEPLVKGDSAVFMTLRDMKLSKSIGGQPLDWGKLDYDATKPTEVEVKKQFEKYENDLNKARANSNISTLAYEYHVASSNNLQSDVIDAISDEVNAWKTQYFNTDGTVKESAVVTTTSQVKSGNFADGMYSVAKNGILTDSKDLKNLTMFDLLSKNITLFYQGSAAKTNLSQGAKGFLEGIASVFGYEVPDSNTSEMNITGRGLNVDENSYKALEYAYKMITRKFLGTNDVVNCDSSRNKTSLASDNDVYQKTNDYNRIVVSDSNGFAGVNVSNMLSAFLTYYANYLDSNVAEYVVSRNLDGTVFVTENAQYGYVVEVADEVVSDDPTRRADFYDELYNNILEHGWREDCSVQDPEYLENALKNGVYVMSSLNKNDGYYYQTRYNNTDYIVEVSDTDAIARAEAEFTAMKAEITYKEDSIDIKTKKLDTEIAALTTEYDTVKNMITQGIQKTFQMFQS